MVCEVGTCIYGVVYVSLDTFKKFYYTGAILGIVILLFVYLPMYTLFIQNFSIFVSNLSLSLNLSSVNTPAHVPTRRVVMSGNI